MRFLELQPIIKKMRKCVVFLFVVPGACIVFPAICMGEQSCPSSDLLKADFAKKDIPAKCPTLPGLECRPVLTRVADSSESLQNELKEACTKLDTEIKRLPAMVTQQNSNGQAADLYSGLANNFKDLIKHMDRDYNGIKAEMVKPQGPLDPMHTGDPNCFPEKNNIQRSVQNDGMKNYSPSPPSLTCTDSGLNAARSSADYMKKIKTVEDGLEDLRAKFSDMSERAQTNADRSKTPTNTESSTSTHPSTIAGATSGIGLDSLAALAAAGGTLAGAMKKQPAAADAAAGATSPTPSSTNEAAATAPAGPASSKLGGNQAGSAAPNFQMIPEAAKAGPPGSSAHFPDGGPFGEKSDISKSGASMAAKELTTASTKANGGGSGSGSGAAGDSGASRRDPGSTAAMEKKDDEAMQGIGGGGLNGGGSSSGPSSAPPPGADTPATAAEDSMKDLLHDMKDAANDTDGKGDGNAQSGNEPSMNAEDLFPRVRACYVRRLKQGLVMNGLGDRISP